MSYTSQDYNWNYDAVERIVVSDADQKMFFTDMTFEAYKIQQRKQILGEIAHVESNMQTVFTPMDLFWHADENTLRRFNSAFGTKYKKGEAQNLDEMLADIRTQQGWDPKFVEMLEEYNKFIKREDFDPAILFQYACKPGEAYQQASANFKAVDIESGQATADATKSKDISVFTMYADMGGAKFSEAASQEVRCSAKAMMFEMLRYQEPNMTAIEYLEDKGKPYTSVRNRAEDAGIAFSGTEYTYEKVEGWSANANQSGNIADFRAPRFAALQEKINTLLAGFEHKDQDKSHALEAVRQAASKEFSPQNYTTLVTMMHEYIIKAEKAQKGVMHRGYSQSGKIVMTMLLEQDLLDKKKLTIEDDKKLTKHLAKMTASRQKQVDRRSAESIYAKHEGDFEKKARKRSSSTSSNTMSAESSTEEDIVKVDLETIRIQLLPLLSQFHLTPVNDYEDFNEAMAYQMGRSAAESGMADTIFTQLEEIGVDKLLLDAFEQGRWSVVQSQLGSDSMSEKTYNGHRKENAEEIFQQAIENQSTTDSVVEAQVGHAKSVQQEIQAKLSEYASLRTIQQAVAINEVANQYGMGWQARNLDDIKPEHMQALAVKAVEHQDTGNWDKLRDILGDDNHELLVAYDTKFQEVVAQNANKLDF